MSAREDAARWFAARRRGVMTLEECAAHEKWLASGANRAAMTEMEGLWAALEGAGERNSDIARDAELASQSWHKIMVAVMCVISLGIGALSYTGNPSFWTSLDWTNR
jgi:ferric-dicitrate binding protein FerR (iron transport regulator)